MDLRKKSIIRKLMSDSDLRPEDHVKNPMILKLLEALKDMPEYVQKRHERLVKRKEFIRQVWEQAMIDAGFLKGPLKPGDY